MFREESQQMLAKYMGLFGAYTKQYLNGLILEEHRPMAVLKVVHTQKVRAEMKRLGAAIGLDARALFLAELSGLFHDIGRFEQLRRFGTFVDRKSVDHARLSAEIVVEQGFLSDLQKVDRESVVSAIRRHNMRTVPPASMWLESVLTLLLRDADKLDIWRVFHEHYSVDRPGTREEDSTLELGMPDTPGISPQVYEDIMAGRIVDISCVKNRNDFAMARLAWIFDINFVPTLMEIHRRGYIPAMEEYLPDFEGKKALFQRVTGYVSDMIARPSSL